MRFVLSIAILLLLAPQAWSQTVANSIFAEYGYPAIPKDSTILQTMYGYSKFRVYTDDLFFKVEAFQDLPEENLEELGAGLRSVFIKDRKSGNVFICVALDTLLIRMRGGETEQASFREMTEAFNSGTTSVLPKSAGQVDIIGYPCRQYLVKGTFTDSVTAYLTDRIMLGKGISDFPMYVSGEGKNYGLLLGRDETLWNGYTLAFRALRFEINQPRDVAKELASYKLVTEEEGDQMIKDWFARLMEMPVEGKN